MRHSFDGYEDVERYLNAIPTFGQSGASAATFGLERIEQICSRMGHPEAGLRVIHVAGTNGKGTTCRMLASVCEEAGYRTGLYISPHLIDIRERIQINGHWIPCEEMLQFFRSHGEILEDIRLSYFELITAIALWYFARQSCDLVVLETGLGGRLDATNVVDPVVSVITSISEDHTDLLGESVAEIAMEKAGIIKKSRPVVTGVLDNEAGLVIRRTAEERGSEYYSAGDLDSVWSGGQIRFKDRTGGSWSVDGTGRKEIDRVNAATVFLVVELLETSHPGLKSAYVAGMEAVNRRYPQHATFERLDPNEEWYFDGAHNREAVDTMFRQLEHQFADRQPTVVLSLMKEKATPVLLDRFRHCPELLYIDIGTERSAACNDIRRTLVQTRCFDVEVFKSGHLLKTFKSELVIFTGSFYFYYQVKHWIASHSSSDQTIRSGSGSQNSFSP